MNIRKIIKEEIDNFDWIDQSGIETPLSWLIDNFGDLTPVVDGNRTYYVDNNNEKLFYYYQNEKNGFCYIKYDDIWSVLESRFGLKYIEVMEVITRWLDEVYGLTGLKPLGNLSKS